MSFVPKTQAFNAKINAVTLGTGDKAVVLGGQNVLPFYTFDAPMENAPKIGVEISDLAKECDRCPAAGVLCRLRRPWPTMAKKAGDHARRRFPVCLHFECADPNGREPVRGGVRRPTPRLWPMRSPCPSLVMGCKNVEKDAELFSKISEALQGKNILVLSAREEDYKAVGASAALAYGQKVGAESAVDINLAKQLNVMLTQPGRCRPRVHRHERGHRRRRLRL